eukprot:TRINITY_DN7775_c0_g1_i1.p2 TRINITY_DN7775_c0_g1~~TRINITY_DN7775_c0_g1_i1.p2  ORF type:complete len:115 (+),score=26.60 TRINITY_DN7775_c0_g1_i1:87-431(+)
MEGFMEEMLEWWIGNEELTEKLENFVGKHCSKFPDPNPDGSTPEQTAELMGLYTEYKDMVENAIEAYLKSKGVDAGAFYEHCKSADDSAILQWVLAATEYEAFWRTMVEEKNSS